ncbi:phospholipase [Bacteroides sp. 224]|nr:phospholipase [Bacteroides sp. 224]
MLQYIASQSHYPLLMQQLQAVKHTLWIGTADLKDLYVKPGNVAIPLLAVLEQKIRQDVSIRLIHAKEPGKNFREDFDKYPLLWEAMERVLCPRVHFKMLIFDLQSVYIGSANLTGAAFGMKSETTRNFETGLFTDIPGVVEAATNQFDEVWMGKHCKACKRKRYCGDRIG